MTLNAQRKRAAGTDGGAWKDVTLEELKAFFGLNVAMGIVKLPEAKMYWKQKWLTNVPAFGQVMPRNRFFQILHYLHVSDDAAIVPAGQPGYDKLHKIKPLLKLLFLNFEIAYNSFKCKWERNKRSKASCRSTGRAFFHNSRRYWR